MGMATAALKKPMSQFKMLKFSCLQEYLESLPGSPQDKQKVLQRELSKLSRVESYDLLYTWRGFWARPKQLAPEGDWSTWVLRAGRGHGKSRTGAEWVQERAIAHPGSWIALIARTPADARDYMIEGPGGFLRNIHPKRRPKYEPSKRRLTWPNGSWATIFSDEEPDQTRGFSGATAWIDEFGKFQNPVDTWDNLQFGMREVTNDRPRVLITTTPRPMKILRDIEKMRSTIVVVGSSYDNKANLDPAWFENLVEKYEGTRLGRQEIAAEILDDVQGALWTRAMLDEARLRCVLPDMIIKDAMRMPDGSPVASVIGVV